MMPSSCNYLAVERPNEGKRRLTVWLLLVLCGAVSISSVAGPTAGEQIRYRGLFAGKAKLTINGDSRRAEVGETLLPGVTLLSADDDSAIIDHRGDQYRYPRSSTVPVALNPKVTIQRNRSGMFATEGIINGRTVPLLVDTGATTVVINGALARKLKLRPNYSRPVRVQTASGVERAYPLELDSVQVGNITVNEVSALVLRGNYPAIPLLGNSFLSQVQMRQADGQLTLSR